MPNKYIQFTVTGTVQGVWFRKFTSDTAKKLDLNGWVRNEINGSVHGEIEGEEKYILIFINKLKSGSKFSKVKNIDINWLDFANKYNLFEILY